MKPENAIEVKDVTRSFKIYLDRGNSIKEFTLFRKRRRYERREVLRGISFEVKKGEAVGLIGHNGCGKSTTLKLLTRILYPESGTVEVKGRVSSLIELGAGFHPDMSGRENIYINASIFGLGRREIDQRIDDIVEFSELQDYIDNPVRTYSSGMYMRLAFSVAINVDADILLIDEILAVGDVAFQAKCFNKLREIKSNGTTIVIVSHSLGQIEQICDRSIWIHEGCIKEDGLPREVDPHYMEYMSEIAAQNNKTKKENIQKIQAAAKDDSKRFGSKEAVIERISCLDSKGQKREEFYNFEPISILIEYSTEKDISDAVVGIAMYRDDQTYIYGTNTLIDYAKPIILKKRGTIRVDFPSFPLNAGGYTLDFAFHRPDGFNYDFWKEACHVIIKNKHDEVGIVSIQHDWEID